MPISSRLGLAALLLLAGFGVAPRAQIRALTLQQMMHEGADGVVYGQIVASHAFRVDSLVDGPELYYTRVTLQGVSLLDDQPVTIDVTFRGGFVSPTEGVYNSEAPAADDVQLGKKVVAFYTWTDDFGGGVPANALTAAHGGLYRTVDGPRGAAVLGRGEGYAIGANVRLEQLASSVKLLATTRPVR